MNRTLTAFYLVALVLATTLIGACRADIAPATPAPTATIAPTVAPSAVGPSRPTAPPPTVASGSLQLHFTLAGTDQAIVDGACPSGLSLLTPTSQDKCLAHGVNSLVAEATDATGAPVFQLVVNPAADQILVLDGAGNPLFQSAGNILAPTLGSQRPLSFAPSDVYRYLLRLDYDLRADGSYDLSAEACGRNQSGDHGMSLSIPSAPPGARGSPLAASVYFAPYRAPAPVAFGISQLAGAPIASAAAQLGGFDGTTDCQP